MSVGNSLGGPSGALTGTALDGVPKNSIWGEQKERSFVDLAPQERNILALVSPGSEWSKITRPKDANAYSCCASRVPA